MMLSKDCKFICVLEWFGLLNALLFYRVAALYEPLTAEKAVEDATFLLKKIADIEARMEAWTSNIKYLSLPADENIPISKIVQGLKEENGAINTKLSKLTKNCRSVKETWDKSFPNLH
jgi:hypothetical protein